MKIFMHLTIVLMFAILVIGCPKKPTIVKEEATAPAVDAKAREEKGRKEVDGAKAKAEAEEKARKEAQEKARREADKAAAFRAEDIHFDFDRSDIKEKDREMLKGLADWLMKNNNAKLRIEGHCDERGSGEYNLALGERRAHGAKQYLTTLGVSESRMTSISFGEEKPLCSESDEDCWWKNRRAHFKIQ